VDSRPGLRIASTNGRESQLLAIGNKARKVAGFVHQRSADETFEPDCFGPPAAHEARSWLSDIATSWAPIAAN
jgi:hypothetical protein